VLPPRSYLPVSHYDVSKQAKDADVLRDAPLSALANSLIKDNLWITITLMRLLHMQI